MNIRNVFLTGWQPFLLLALLVGLFPPTSKAQLQIGSDIDGEAAADYSGRSVSMPDANTVAIGASQNDGNGTDAGHVRVYTWNSSAWTQKGADIDGEAADDYSGASVDMPDTNTVAIGALFNDGNLINSGHVRVYTWNGNTWTQKGADMDGEAGYDRSGKSVSMPDANTVAIGADDNDGSGSKSGHVRVYTWNGSAWTQKGADIDGEAAGDRSGWSVSMPDANTVAIGAPFNDGKGINSGHVRLYTWNGSTWLQKGADIDGEETHDQLGWSVSMPDTNTVAIGAHITPVIGAAVGYVRIYVWNDSAWTQKGADMDWEGTYNWSGYSVSMPDSNAVAIGAPYIGNNGSSSGHVRVYTWNDSAWTQRGTGIDGEAGYDYSGYSVSMPNGNTFAIGAPQNKGNGSSSGHVRVYSLSNEVDTSVNVASPVLTANASNVTYQWIDCGSLTPLTGETGQTFTATANGSYALVVTENGCTDTSACYQVTNAGITENNPLSPRVYPNPARGVFTIEWPDAGESKTYEITDVRGKVVHKGVIRYKRTEVNLSGFNHGIYLLRTANKVVKLSLKP